MPSYKVNCDLAGRKHEWRERTERYSLWSSQSVGTYWVCVLCGATSDEKPKE